MGARPVGPLIAPGNPVLEVVEEVAHRVQAELEGIVLQLNPGAAGELTESALHAQHLLEGVDDVDHVSLCGHHRIDVLVGARNLVEHAGILAG